MAEETKKTETKITFEETPVKEVKTKQVEIIKFHPLVAHEVGDQPFLEEKTADRAD
jgi:hypothetical protein